MEEQLAAGLGERQIAELVQNDEVEPGEMIGDATLAAGTGVALPLVDETDDVEEAAALRIGATLTGVSANSKSSISLASGNLAAVSWYLMERACFSETSAESKSPTIRGGSC